MSLYTELERLDPENEEHVNLVVNLAKTKARYNTIVEWFHRKDDKVIAALKAYRAARNAVRAAAAEVGAHVGD